MCSARQAGSTATPRARRRPAPSSGWVAQCLKHRRHASEEATRCAEAGRVVHRVLTKSRYSLPTAIEPAMNPTGHGVDLAPRARMNPLSAPRAGRAVARKRGPEAGEESLGDQTGVQRRRRRCIGGVAPTDEK